MIVLITSSTPNRVRRNAAIPAQQPPPIAPTKSASGNTAQPSPLPHARPTAAAAAAPMSSWPSAPMFHTPARNATATARPVNTSGVARTSVDDVNAYQLPNEPRHNAPSASEASNPARRSANQRTASDTTATTAAAAPV